MSSSEMSENAQDDVDIWAVDTLIERIRKGEVLQLGFPEERQASVAPRHQSPMRQKSLEPEPVPSVFDYDPESQQVSAAALRPKTPKRSFSRTAPVTPGRSATVEDVVRHIVDQLPAQEVPLLSRPPLSRDKQKRWVFLFKSLSNHV